MGEFIKSDGSVNDIDKREKVNKIKYWLLRHGERDEDGFSHDIIFKNFHGEDTVYSLSLGYNYGVEGEEFNEVSFCRKSFKHLRNNSIKDLTIEELDDIIEILFD
jgi:hypothetical protein